MDELETPLLRVIYTILEISRSSQYLLEVGPEQDHPQNATSEEV